MSKSQDRPCYEARDILCAKFIDVHKVMVHAKFQSSKPFGFKHKDSEVCIINACRRLGVNIKAPCLPVSVRKNFEVGLLCSYVPSCDPRGVASFNPRGTI